MSTENKPDGEKLQELLDRSIRTESRLVQLGDHVGANLRQKLRIDIHYVDPERKNVKLDIDSMDVSLSRVANELQRHQIRSQAVGVWLEGHLVATVYPRTMNQLTRNHTP